MPVNAHPDSTFSSHVHNDWTYAQLSAQEYPGENVQNLAQGYEGMFRQDNRMFPEFEDQGDYVQLAEKEYPAGNI